MVGAHRALPLTPHTAGTRMRTGTNTCVGQQDGITLGQFTRVDSSGDSDRLVAFLDHLEQLPQFISIRERSYQLLRAKTGDRVVDVGCGTGKAVAELNARGLLVTGVDRSEDMLARARQRFPRGDFRAASAEALPFASGSLQAYRAERLYTHIAQPLGALAEAQRVLAPGGRLVLVDPESDLIVVDSDDRPMARSVVQTFAATVANAWLAWSGRSMLLEAGFVEVAVEVPVQVYTRYFEFGPVLAAMARAAVGADAITAVEAESWLAEQRHRDQQGRFFVAMPVLVGSARRPSCTM